MTEPNRDDHGHRPRFKATDYSYASSVNHESDKSDAKFDGPKAWALRFMESIEDSDHLILLVSSKGKDRSGRIEGDKAWVSRFMKSIDDSDHLTLLVSSKGTKSSRQNDSDSEDERHRSWSPNHDSALPESEPTMPMLGHNHPDDDDADIECDNCGAGDHETYLCPRNRGASQNRGQIAQCWYYSSSSLQK